MAAHRSRKRHLFDHLVAAAGIRVYRCDSCGRRYHGAKWLKMLAPLPIRPRLPQRRYFSSRWLHRYYCWRLREGRHIHRSVLFAAALLAAVGGFFFLLWNAHLFFG